MSNIVFLLCVSLSLIQRVSQSEESINKQLGHDDSLRVSTTDDCSHVQNPYNKPVKMLPDTFPGVYWGCCLGNPGFKLTGPCEQGKPNTTVVERCKEGTYISEFAHIRKKCDVDDLVCPDPFIKIPSNITQAPQCVCKDGFFINQNKECTPYSKCGPGWGVFRHGNTYNDTKCEQCKRGFHSPSSSSSERCLLNSSSSSIESNESKNITSPTPSVNHSNRCACPNKTSSISNTTNIMITTQITDPGDGKNFALHGLNLFYAIAFHPISISSNAFFVLICSCVWIVIIRYFPGVSKHIKEWSFTSCCHPCRRRGRTSRGESNTSANDSNTLLMINLDGNDGRASMVEDVASNESTNFQASSTVEQRYSILGSHEESPPISASFPATSTRSIADADKENKKRIKEFKMFLTEEVDRDETKKLYRLYCAEPNPKIFLDDCERHNMFTSDIFDAVWSRLEKRGTEQFNPKLVLEFFVSIDNKLIADKIRKKFSDLI